jgi:hypothetical protein
MPLCIKKLKILYNRSPITVITVILLPLKILLRAAGFKNLLNHNPDGINEARGRVALQFYATKGGYFSATATLFGCYSSIISIHVVNQRRVSIQF